MSFKSNISNKQQLLMQSLTQFFKENDNINEYLSITQSSSNISLRVIDWFVTNYSRDHEVSYEHQQKKTPFIVHDSYKSQLKAYSKRQFDPFCRRMRINFYYKPSKKIVTTVGQLNFFRWAIENGIIEYIRNNFKEIEKHMKKYVKLNREAKKQRKKYQQIGGNKKAPMSPKSIKSMNAVGGKTKRKGNTTTNASKRSISKHNMQTMVFFH